jgi:peptidoglycan/LPS O-acetylase OafA/YrhL
MFATSYKLIYPSYAICTQDGRLCVDFFFIISGFFLTLKFNETESVLDFVKKKIARLQPVLIFSLAVYPRGDAVYTKIFSAIFCDNIGFTMQNGGNCWFVSVLFWAMLLYFYMIKYYRPQTVNLVVALTVIFSYSFAIHVTNGRLVNDIRNYAYIFNTGMLRGLGGIGIGYFIANGYKYYQNKVSNKNMSIAKRIVTTIAEMYLFGWLVFNLCFHKLHFNNNIIFIVVFAFLFWMFLVRKGYFSKLLDNNFSAFLGKYSYSIFLMHMPVIHLYRLLILNKHQDLMVNNHRVLNICIPIVFSVIAGMLTYHLVEIPGWKFLKKKLGIVP